MTANFQNDERPAKLTADPLDPFMLSGYHQLASIATSFETQRPNLASPNGNETIASGSRVVLDVEKSTSTQFAGFSADFPGAGRRSAIASLDWDSIADVRRQRAALKVTRDQ